jgi:hypothetical protein
MGVISKLDAINHMLLMAGESMVSDLDNLGGVDTEVCETILDRLILDFQTRGLANNKYNLKYTLDADGEISLGGNIISAELISSHSNDDGFQIIGVGRYEDSSQGITKLWNVTDQTLTWKSDRDYWVEIIKKIDWEAMDTPVQRAVLSSAARQYQIIMQGDVEADKYLQELEIMYTVKGKSADTDDKRRTIFGSGTPKLRDIHNRASSYNDPSRFRFWRTTNG